MEEKSPLGELRKRLYKKDESFERRMRRPELTPDREKVPPFWRDPQSDDMPKPKKSIFSWKLAILIIVIFTALGGGTFYFLFGGIGGVSNKNIEIKIIAPENLEGGERITWEVFITNDNRKALDAAELIFEYPIGTRVLDPNVRSLRERRSLGVINPRETVKASFDAFLFGEENENKTVRAILEYRPADSSAILAKETEFTTNILRSPIGISFELPPEIRVGQEVDIKLDYTSNAKSTLTGLVLEVEYPAGFEFSRGIPGPESNGSTWRIGALAPNETGSIVIKGKISGEDLEEKSFRARAGKLEVDGFNVYGGAVAVVTIRRPFLDVQVKMKDEKIYTVKAGEAVDTEIFFQNNLSVAIQNVVVEAVIKGRGLDEQSVDISGGNYRSSTKTATWNASSAEILRQLNPGEGGSFRLRFFFLEPIPINSSSDKNFQIDVEARIRPGVIPPGFTGVDVSSIDKAQARLISEIQLVRRGLYFTNILPNSGPLPPKVGSETTFTVIWSLTNSVNDADGLTVRASLPSYMNWKSVVTPDDGTLSFNPASSEIIWNAGLLRAGTGFLRPAKEIAFQVGLVPGVDQIGSLPVLVTEVRAEARDLFVNSSLEASAQQLSTRLESDLQVGSEDGVVIP